jgi:trans-L-3-hydroxyproline dehydratase
MHNEGYSTQCGHGIIAITTVALETGFLPITGSETTVRIDTPSGMVTAHGRVSEGRVKAVSFQNVPSFVLAIDEKIDVPGLGGVRYDLAFGGAFYAYVQAEELGVSCTPECLRRLIEKGMAIKRAIMRERPIPHPFEEDLSFLYGTIFIGPPLGSKGHSRNVCIFAEGQVDRSPTGSGLSGRLAIHHARGEIRLGESMVVESIIGSCFSGRIVETTTFGPHTAVVPEIEGTAHITGRHEFLIDLEDSLREGFLLR